MGGARNRGEQRGPPGRQRLGKCGYWVQARSQSVGALLSGARGRCHSSWRQCWLSQRCGAQPAGGISAQGAQLISVDLGWRQGRCGAGAVSAAGSGGAQGNPLLHGCACWCGSPAHACPPATKGHPSRGPSPLTRRRPPGRPSARRAWRPGSVRPRVRGCRMGKAPAARPAPQSPAGGERGWGGVGWGGVGCQFGGELGT